MVLSVLDESFSSYVLYGYSGLSIAVDNIHQSYIVCCHRAVCFSELGKNRQVLVCIRVSTRMFYLRLVSHNHPLFKPVCAYLEGHYMNARHCRCSEREEIFDEIVRCFIQVAETQKLTLGAIIFPNYNPRIVKQENTIQKGLVDPCYHGQR